MFSEMAMDVMKARYLRKDVRTGELLETPEGMFKRVATALEDKDFYSLMNSLDFLPNTPTLVNAGRPKGQLSACFVLPIEDSMDGIFTSLHDAAMIHKTGGGTGFSFSRLRAKGSPVFSTSGTSSGVVSFLHVYNEATNSVKQGGVRRGANMGILRVDHPDIEEFIMCKDDPTQITNFNLSVGIIPGFMKAVKDDADWNLIDPAHHNVVKTLKAKQLWALIIHQAWKNGEPGVVFLDTINKFNPTPEYGEIESTNPCLTGDTLIKTVEGMIPIKDLVGQEIDVFCLNDQGQLTISTARNIRLTRKQATLISVHTTKGTVTCTPEHKFYTRNRGYVEAQHLRATDKLVALCVAPKNQKYVKVYPSGTSAQVQAEHVFIAKHYYGDLTGKDVHHVDDNPKHNVFSNLEVLNHGDHSVVSNRGHINWAEHDPVTGRWLPKIKETKDWSNPTGVHPIGTNMRLLGVTSVEHTEDVYDLEVDDYHNFFANYVCVHNCGEQPLLPYESCNLGSINLLNHVAHGRIDYGHLGQTVRLSVKFLNAVLDHNHYPLEKITECTLRTRKIGLGVMGWADTLLALGMKYESPEALQLAEDVMQFINDTAWEYSKKHEYNNATCTTIAPTGTISMIANVSGGIEPNFSWVYVRKAMDKDFYVVHPLMEKELRARGIYNDATLKLLYKGTPLNQIPGLNDLPDYWQLAHQVSSEYHIRMQAAFQKYTDNAVSKTINLDNSATEDDVRHAYELAYQLGCKGVTVYRDGCRANQVLNNGEQKKEMPSAAVRERPVETVGTTRKVTIGCGKLYVTVNSDESGKPIEVFTNTGKAGGCPAQSEGLARMISLALRYNVPADVIIKQLRGIRCMSTIRKEGCAVLSCPDAISRVLEHSMGDPKAELSKATIPGTSKVCPECGQPLETSEGCVICHSCGYSKCN